MLAADIVEIDVYALRGRRAKLFKKASFGLVVDDGIRAEFVNPCALAGSSSGGDDGQSPRFRQLDDHGTHRTGGTRNEDDIAVLGQRDIEQSEISGQTGAAQNAQ